MRILSTKSDISGQALHEAREKLHAWLKGQGFHQHPRDADMWVMDVKDANNAVKGSAFVDFRADHGDPVLGRRYFFDGASESSPDGIAALVVYKEFRDGVYKKLGCVKEAEAAAKAVDNAMDNAVAKAVAKTGRSAIQDLQKRYVDHTKGGADAKTPAVQNQKAPSQAVAVQGGGTPAPQSAIPKNFMTVIEGVPKELAVELGVGDKKKRYATCQGLWFAFYTLGLKVRSCKVIHEHWTWQTGQIDGHEDPRAGEAWCKCEFTVMGQNGEPDEYYEAYGDATAENVKLDDIRQALDRMAETRSIDRTLRMITAGGWRQPVAGVTITPEQQKVMDVIKSCESAAVEELIVGTEVVP